MALGVALGRQRRQPPSGQTDEPLRGHHARCTPHVTDRTTASDCPVDTVRHQGQPRGRRRSNGGAECRILGYSPEHAYSQQCNVRPHARGTYDHGQRHRTCRRHTVAPAERHTRKGPVAVTRGRQQGHQVPGSPRVRHLAPGVRQRTRLRAAEQGCAACAVHAFCAVLLVGTLRDIRHPAPVYKNRYARPRHARPGRGHAARYGCGGLFHHRPHGGVSVRKGCRHERRRLQQSDIRMQGGGFIADERGRYGPGHRERQPLERGEQHPPV